MKVISGTSVYYIEDCANCNMEFAMTEAFRNKRLADKKLFYCPSGHSQSYVGETAEQKLRKELEAEKTRADKLQLLLRKKTKRVK